MARAIKRFIAIKTRPVIIPVIIKVSSILLQLEATGVDHQGVTTWKIMEKITISTKAMASAIVSIPESMCLSRFVKAVIQPIVWPR
jgi:hypothetical protein